MSWSRKFNCNQGQVFKYERPRWQLNLISYLFLNFILRITLKIILSFILEKDRRRKIIINKKYVINKKEEDRL